MTIEFGPNITPAEYGQACLIESKPIAGNKTQYTFCFLIDGIEMFDRIDVDNDSQQELVIYSSYDVAVRTFNQYWTKYNRDLSRVMETMN